MKHLIIGAGEIGTALQEIFNCDIRDKENGLEGEYDVIHIAFPYFEGFEAHIQAYKELYSAKYVVVHSTVPVGTCKMIGAVHSPVTGVHPHLKESILTFTKFVSDEDMAIEFSKHGIRSKYIENSDETEAGKLFALLIYGINIIAEKEIFKYCETNNLKFKNVYEEMVKNYNVGYRKMGMGHFQMFELIHNDGKIGGHCVIQNSPMLKTPLSDFLERYNSEF